MTRMGIAAESDRDLSWVCGLADRILCNDVEWIEPEIIDSFRTWCGHGGHSWMDLHRASDEARARGLRVYGHFDGEPGAIDAHMFRTIFLLFLYEEVQPDVVVVSRDVDGDEERLQGFHQAARGPWPFSVVGAIARPELEAWLIAAFSPASAEEGEALPAVRQRIGFDPRLHPERLTSKRPEDKKDAKRVLDEISVDDPDRVKESWDSAPLDELIERGIACGLANYIDDVRPRRGRDRSRYRLIQLADPTPQDPPFQAHRRATWSRVSGIANGVPWAFFGRQEGVVGTVPTRLRGLLG